MGTIKKCATSQSTILIYNYIILISYIIAFCLTYIRADKWQYYIVIWLPYSIISAIILELSIRKRNNMIDIKAFEFADIPLLIQAIIIHFMIILSVINIVYKLIMSFASTS